MSRVFFLAGGSQGSSGASSPDKVIALDVVTDITGNFPSKPTKHPIEGGSEVTDHVINENATFSFTGAVSNHMTGPNGNNLLENPMISVESPNRPVKAFQELQKLRNNKTLFTLVTSYGTFPNCVMTNFSPKEKSGYSAQDTLEVDISVEQLRIFASEQIIVGVAATLNIPDQNGSSGGKVNSEALSRLAVFFGGTGSEINNTINLALSKPTGVFRAPVDLYTALIGSGD